MLQKQKTTKDTWDALVTKMTKPSKVLTSLQHQLRNLTCSEEENLRQHLDKAQDLFAHLNDMGAKTIYSEFLDILLASLPPSYESIMNALITSLGEVRKPLEIDNIIRILKSQYNRRKTQSTTQEEQGFTGTSSKKVHTCTNCKKKVILLKTAGLKVVERKDKDLNRKRDPSPKGKKREGEGKCS